MRADALRGRDQALRYHWQWGPGHDRRCSAGRSRAGSQLGYANGENEYRDDGDSLSCSSLALSRRDFLAIAATERRVYNYGNLPKCFRGVSRDSNSMCASTMLL